MLSRIIGVLKLDVRTFEEIEADPNATGQAAIIVTVVAILSAIGAFFGARAGTAGLQSLSEQFGADFPIEAVPSISPVSAAISAILASFIAWIIWSVLTYLIGTNLFQGRATIGEMLRVLGFAQAPYLLSIFSFIPCLGAIISLVAAIWSLIAGFIAVRQGLDLDNVKTAVTVVISWIIAVIINLCVLGPIFSFIG